MTEGYDESEAIFIALTTVKGKAVGNDRVRITDSFPTGNQAVINIRLVPDSGANPERFTIKTADSGQGFKFSLEYYVPYTAIPAEAQPAVALGGPASGDVVLAAFASVPAAGDANGVKVVVGGVVDQFRGDRVDDFVKYLGEKTKNTRLEKLNGKVKAGLVVKEVLDMGEELAGYLAEIDRLERCAKNPSDPLTKKAYEKDPGERARILKEIDGVRSELKGNAAAGVIGTINSAGAGLVKSAPWLGYIVGPGTAWALDNFKQVAQDRLNELRKGITSCDYLLDQTSAEGSSLKGTKCDGRDGEWVFRALIDSSGIHSEAVYTVIIGKGALDGTYQWSNTTVVADAVVTVNASGHASIAPQKDGSILMKLDASNSTSTAAGDGGQQTIAVPFPAQSFKWKVGVASCDLPS